jgi:hypothetical protein
VVDAENPYVMVPVPKEHVTEVMTHMLRVVARSSIERWEEDSLQAFLDELDDASRALLSLTAEAAVTNETLTDADVAERVNLSRREAVAIVREVTESAQRDKRPPLITTRNVEASDDSPRDAVVFEMAANMAKMVLGAGESGSGR